MGSYVSNSLGPNEKIVYQAKVSWFSQMLLFALGCVLLFALGIGVVCWIIALVRIYTTELAITDRRVIAKFGLIRRSTIELRLEKIESVQVEQSILGRMFNYGSIVVSGAGASQAPIPGISFPLRFRGQLNSLLEKKEAA
jgi:uncharacterized membrane protein YdbT with pleckstrin-like domain